MTRQPDSVRNYHLYRYLLGRLAISRKKDGSPNNKQTGQRVGDESIRKILPAILANQTEWNTAVEKHKKYESTTTGQLVEMLSALRESLIQDYRSHDITYDRILGPEEILTALYQLVELTPSERKQLGLPIGDKLTLLKQTLLSLQAKGRAENYEAVFRAYKEAVGLRFAGSDDAITTLDEVYSLIESAVRAELAHLPHRTAVYPTSQTRIPSNKDTMTELSRKAQREVRRLLVRSGNTQAFFKDSNADHAYISEYLQSAFVRKLSQTVVQNERLTYQFPVFLKRLTIKSRGPLPFSDTSLGIERFSSTYPRLLDTGLQELDGSAEHKLSGDIPNPSDYELASQSAAKVTLHFYVKVPAYYQSVVPQTFKKLVSDSADNGCSFLRVDFTYSSTGVGGTLSHIVKVINALLLSGIPCLSHFFPIAHDVTSTQTIIRDNVSSPVWAHSLVKLCHRQSVSDALWSFREEGGEALSTYDNFSFGDPIGHGDFCGFDFLLAQAQSALNARLRAIYNTGINPEDYIRELCEKVERETALEHAWKKLHSYPFSVMAMVGSIHEAILSPTFQKPRKNLEIGDSKIYFDAYLSIAEALLSEGAYKAAYRNLKRVSVLEDYGDENLISNGDRKLTQGAQTFISSSLIIRYLICKAFYYYLYDLEEWDNTYWKEEFPSGVSRQQLITRAWETLALAQKHIKARLDKYVVIGEISQGTFHPHYHLLSRIYLLRARLLTFFPRLVPKSDTLLPTEDFHGRQRTAASIHWGKLFLLEKARLYTAADGDSDAYTYYAALQSCYYLTVAFENPENTQLTNRKTEVTRQLTRQHCLDWARKLRDHALLTYARTGRTCYNAIKEKSGLPGEFEDHGRYSIEKLPAIFEDRGLQREISQSESDQFLTLDVSLLAISSDRLPRLTSKYPQSSIYLYGTNSCHLFFVRGLYLLCSDESEEFESTDGPIDWEDKLRVAGRLFDLAWAIAEDGCVMERESGTKQKQIKRSFKSDYDSGQYVTREITSVRDLYPRRVNEIADIAKIFSATCMMLKTYLLPAESRGDIFQDIDDIFEMVHGKYRFKEDRNELLKCLLLRQERYNGHIEVFLKETRDVIKRFKPELGTAYVNVTEHRDALLKEIFGTLIR